MNPEEMKLPKLEQEAFQLRRFPFPIPDPGDPAILLRVFREEEFRVAIGAYAQFHANVARAAGELYSRLGEIAGHQQSQQKPK